MQFVDLKKQQERIRADIEGRISAVLDHGKYIMGPEVGELERLLADFCGVEQAVGCASGTDALLMALMALEVGPGDAVYTSPFTFISTAEVISLLGATPVFVDIDPRTFNIDPNLLADSIENGPPDGLKAKAVITVDLFGLPADFDPIRQTANEFGLYIIEDAAQSFGAEYKGRKACALGDITCTSFFPAKPLGCYGDGGMCFTDDEKLDAAMRSIRVHGKGREKYDNVRIGINGRLDTVQAAILLSKFSIFPEEIQLRNEAAHRYALLLEGGDFTLPFTPEHSTSVWAQYSILAQSQGHRTEVMAKLKEGGIPSAIYYPKPLHMQTAYANLGHDPEDFPVSKDCSERIFSLPMHPYLTEEDQQAVADALLAG